MFYVFLLVNLHSFQSLKLLAVMAAIRLDGDAADRIAETLVLALLDAKKVDKSSTANDPLASSTWDKVSLVFMEECF